MTTTESKTNSSSSDSGFQFHQKSNSVLLKAALDMEMDAHGKAEDILKHLDFYIMASNAYLRTTCNDKKFSEKTPIQALYDGRDVFVDMMRDYVQQYRENRGDVVKN